MIKTIFKESIIILLLCVAILLVLSILFYDYNPINTVVPNKIAYTTPENIKNELEEETIENTLGSQNRVYAIEGSDLNIYKKNNAYNASKDNPFASTPSEDSGTTSVNTIKNDIIQNNTNAENNTQKTNTNNSETAKQNKGLK